MGEPVIVEMSDGIVQVTLNRPDRRNALTGEMARIVACALDELDRRADLRVAIVTGVEGVFSSGMDLNAYLAGDRPSVPGRGLMGFAERAPAKPVIAAVEGWALAAGFELALACDLVVSGEGAVFGLPEAKRGLVAAGGGLVRLAQRVPYAVALEIALTARHFGAAEAHGLGIVNRVVPDGAALAEAHKLAEQIVGNAPQSVRVSKEIIRLARTWPTEQDFAVQRALLEPLVGSPDTIEGARAFAEKRPPVWQGA